MNPTVHVDSDHVTVEGSLATDFRTFGTSLDAKGAVSRLTVTDLAFSDLLSSALVRYVNSKEPKVVSLVRCDFKVYEEDLVKVLEAAFQARPNPRLVRGDLRISTNFPCGIFGPTEAIVIERCLMGSSRDRIEVWVQQLMIALACSFALKSLTVIETLNQFTHGNAAALWASVGGLEELRLVRNRIRDFGELGVTLKKPTCHIKTLAIDDVPQSHRGALVDLCRECRLFTSLSHLQLADHESLVIADGFQFPPNLQWFSAAGSQMAARSMTNIFSAGACKEIHVGGLQGVPTEKLTEAICRQLKSGTRITIDDEFEFKEPQPPEITEALKSGRLQMGGLEGCLARLTIHANV